MRSAGLAFQIEEQNLHETCDPAARVVVGDARIDRPAGLPGVHAGVGVLRTVCTRHHRAIGRAFRADNVAQPLRSDRVDRAIVVRSHRRRGARNCRTVRSILRGSGVCTTGRLEPPRRRRSVHRIRRRASRVGCTRHRTVRHGHRQPLREESLEQTGRSCSQRRPGSRKRSSASRST
jgi:hypothetical protein